MADIVRGLDAVVDLINKQLEPDAALSYDQVWRLTIRATRPLPVAIFNGRAFARVEGVIDWLNSESTLAALRRK